MKKTFLFSLLLSFLGCSNLETRSEKILEEREPLTLERFLKVQEEREKRLSQVQGKASILYASPKNSVSGEVRFTRFNDSALFEVRDPMGRVRLWIRGEPQGLLAYEEDSQTAWTAPPGSSAYFKKMYAMELSWEELQDLWVGVLPKSWRTKIRPSWQKRSGYFEGVVERESPLHFQVDESTQELRQVSWKSKTRETQIKWEDWEACSALETQKNLLAHRVVMNLPHESDKFELEWEELNFINESPNSLSFKRGLPKGTHLVPLKK